MFALTLIIGYGLLSLALGVVAGVNIANVQSPTQ